MRRWPAPQVAEATLWPKLEMIVGVNIKMSVTALKSDIVLPAAGYPLAVLARRMKRLMHRSQQKDSDIASRLAETFNNMEIIKARANGSTFMESAS